MNVNNVSTTVNLFPIVCICIDIHILFIHHKYNNILKTLSTLVIQIMSMILLIYFLYLFIDNQNLTVNYYFHFIIKTSQ